MMNKNDFIAELRKELNGLPDSDIQRSIDFYTEMIEDKIEDGMTEENAVSELEPPAEIAKKVLSETSISKLVKAKLKPSRELKGWEIALLVLGAPLWLPLIIAFCSCAFICICRHMVCDYKSLLHRFVICCLRSRRHGAGHYICVWRKCRIISILFRGIDCMLRNSCFTLFCIWQNFRSACFCKQALGIKN